MGKKYSSDEKHASYLENGVIEHWMFVHELIELLSHLNQNDWITPNLVNNLTIERDEVGYIGYINFGSNCIDFNSGDSIELADEE